MVFKDIDKINVPILKYLDDLDKIKKISTKFFLHKLNNNSN